MSAHAAKTASSVFPKAIPAAVGRGSFANALAANAPSAIPGQTSRPSSRSAASATPVVGHTSVTCSASNARRRPIQAAAKYAPAVATISAARRIHPL